MIEVTGTAQQWAWTEGRLPPVEQVRPGLWSIPVPIPDNPLRYVLVYALELSGGVALVDAGWGTEEAWGVLCAGLRETGYEASDVRAVLVTHIHADHYGLAGRIREVSGAPIALHPADAALVVERYEEAEGLVDRLRCQLCHGGTPDATADTLSSATHLPYLSGSLLPDILLEDGDRAPLPGLDLRAVWTPGHSPGHLCFYDAQRRLLLSGDHVLPRISPNIMVYPQERTNPLADFIDSLHRVRHLDVDEVLPAHEYRFADLAARVSQLLAHHEGRLHELETVVERYPGSTTWELTARLAWSRPFLQLGPLMCRVAFGETLAHLVFLEAQRRLRRWAGPPERWHPESKKLPVEMGPE